MDAPRGRAVATGLGLPWLSVIDLAAGTRIAAIRFADTSKGYPHVAVDDAGTAWVALDRQPGLVRVDLDAGTAAPIPGAANQAWVMGLAEGVLVQTATGVARLDARGAAVATAAVGVARAAARHPDGVIVVVGPTASVLAADTLAELATCPLPFAASEVAALDDGTVVVSDGTSLGRLVCTSDAGAETWTVGAEITALATDGATVLAVDRVGPDDPTRGVTWAIGATGAPAEAFRTGKNTASGGFDGAGGFWGNSEGSSEVVGWRTTDGVELAAVSTGTSVADLVVAPDGAVFGTGRLSALVGRLDGDTLTRAEPLVWPWAPHLDGDRLVVLDHLQGQLATLDATTLTLRSTLDLGYGSNLLLTFDSVEPAADRGTWLVTESEADVLLEIDLDAGRILQTWPLGGPPVTDRHQGAQLELQYRDGVAFLARTYDGRLTRLDLDSGARTEAWLSEAQLTTLQERRLTRATLPVGDDVWVGPYRIDPASLTVEAEWPQIERLLVPWPDDSGDWLAIDSAGTALVRIDADGVVSSSYAWFAEPEPGTVAVPDPEGGAVWVNRSYEGLACHVPFELIAHGRDAPPSP